MNITDTKAYTECLLQLANVLDLDENRDDYHSWRVACVAYMMAKKLDCQNLLEVFWAGLLHDIGAYGYNDFTVSTSDSLSIFEKSKIYNHTIRSAEIITRELPGDVRKVADFVKYHHEKYDGSGFPEGLAGNDIPIISQLIKVADDFDIALRLIPRLSKKVIYGLFRENIDREYSKEMIDLFVETMENDGFFEQIELEAQIPTIVAAICDIPAIAGVQDRSRDKEAYDRIKSISAWTGVLPFYKMFLETDLLEKMTLVFAHIIDAKHEETLGHSGRVAFYASRIAEYLGLNPRDISRVKLAGFMHDIGKAAVPRTILNKSMNLTRFEMHIVKAHPVLTMEVLRNMSVFHDIIETAGYHHERLNGSGYPAGLPAESIPFLARIVMVADVFDAMASGRRYQRPITKKEAIDYLVSQKNVLFDADAVDAMAAVCESDEAGIATPSESLSKN